MEMTSAQEGSMVQLKTEDSMEKVVEWYTRRVNPSNTLRQPNSVVLRSSGMDVVITTTGRGTNIIIKQLRDQSYLRKSETLSRSPEISSAPGRPEPRSALAAPAANASLDKSSAPEPRKRPAASPAITASPEPTLFRA